MKAWLILALLLGVLGVSWYASEHVFSRPELREMNLTAREHYAEAVIGTKGLSVEVADTEAKRQRGLSDRDTIGRDGMLFVFETPGIHSFWMKDMRFSIDIVWLKDGVVQGLVDSAPAPQPGTSDSALVLYSPPGPIDRVLELPAGAARTYGIEKGTRIELNI